MSAPSLNTAQLTDIIRLLKPRPGATAQIHYALLNLERTGEPQTLTLTEPPMPVAYNRASGRTVYSADVSRP